MHDGTAIMENNLTCPQNVKCTYHQPYYSTPRGDTQRAKNRLPRELVHRCLERHGLPQPEAERAPVSIHEPFTADSDHHTAEGLQIQAQTWPFLHRHREPYSSMSGKDQNHLVPKMMHVRNLMYGRNWAGQWQKEHWKQGLKFHLLFCPVCHAAPYVGLSPWGLVAGLKDGNCHSGALLAAGN